MIRSRRSRFPPFPRPGSPSADYCSGPQQARQHEQNVVACAIFFILELGNPFEGRIAVSADAIKLALAHLRQ
jgi:hypothetical protein